MVSESILSKETSTTAERRDCTKTYVCAWNTINGRVRKDTVENDLFNNECYMDNSIYVGTQI